MGPLILQHRQLSRRSTLNAPSKDQAVVPNGYQSPSYNQAFIDRMQICVHARRTLFDAHLQFVPGAARRCGMAPSVLSSVCHPDGVRSGEPLMNFTVPVRSVHPSRPRLSFCALAPHNGSHSFTSTESSEQ